MRSLEGIKLNEIKESALEKKSITVSDEEVDFNNYDITRKTSNIGDKTLDEEEINFDDCFLTEEERLEILKNELSKKSTIEATENYDDCAKLGK